MVIFSCATYYIVFRKTFIYLERGEHGVSRGDVAVTRAVLQEKLLDRAVVNLQRTQGGKKKNIFLPSTLKNKYVLGPCHITAVNYRRAQTTVDKKIHGYIPVLPPSIYIKKKTMFKLL